MFSNSSLVIPQSSNIKHELCEIFQTLLEIKFSFGHLDISSPTKFVQDLSFEAQHRKLQHFYTREHLANFQHGSETHF